MQKREASFQTVFNKYLRAKRLHGNFELKQTKGKSIAFDAVEDHQLDGLLAAQAVGMVWKYSDQDQRQKPFDCSSLPPLPGYVVIRFPKQFFIIYAKTFLHEKATSTRKSLTQERAKEICLWAVRLSTG